MKRQIFIFLMLWGVVCMAQESRYVRTSEYEGAVISGETCLFVRKHFKPAQRVMKTYHNYRRGEHFAYATIDHGTQFKVTYRTFMMTAEDVARLEEVLGAENRRWNLLDEPTSDYVRQYAGFISSVGDTVVWVNLLKEGLDIYGQEGLERGLIRHRVRKVAGKARMGMAINVTERQLLSFAQW